MTDQNPFDPSQQPPVPPPGYGQPPGFPTQINDQTHNAIKAKT